MFFITRKISPKTKLWLRCDNCGEMFVGIEGDRHGEDRDGWACHGTGRTT